MENRTIAVIGASEERNFSILKELSERYLYYSITIKKHLRIFMKALWQNRHGDIEKMDCA
jgi:hypothetical protein